MDDDDVVVIDDDDDDNTLYCLRYAIYSSILFLSRH